MSFKFSVFTVMIPELGYADAAELVAENGYDGIEWRIGMSGNSNPGDSPPGQARGVTERYTYWNKVREHLPLTELIARAPELKRIAAANGLTMPAMATYLNLATPELLPQAEEVMKAAQIMECPQFRIGSPKYFRGRTKETYHQLFDLAIRQLAALDKLSRRYGIRVNTEIHADSISPSASMTYLLVRDFDPKHIGVILDPGNMIKEGWENWRLGMQLLGNHLVHVHAKNCGWYPKGQRDDGSTNWERPWMPLREGAVDWKVVMEDLKSVGYDGWISLEDFSQRPTEDKLKDDLIYFRQIAAAVEA